MLEYKEVFPVRYYETDQMGIVHHSNYIRYFECARVKMMKDWGYSIVECEKEGFYSPIVEVYCKYKYSAKMGDILTAYAIIKEFTSSVRLIIEQKVVNQEGKVCAEGKSIICFTDKRTLKPVRIPQKIIDIIKTKIGE